MSNVRYKKLCTLAHRFSFDGFFPISNMDSTIVTFYYCKQAYSNLISKPNHHVHHLKLVFSLVFFNSKFVIHIFPEPGNFWTEYLLRPLCPLSCLQRAFSCNIKHSDPRCAYLQSNEKNCSVKYC
jgi:hypothetical protein